MNYSNAQPAFSQGADYRTPGNLPLRGDELLRAEQIQAARILVYSDGVADPQLALSAHLKQAGFLAVTETKPSTTEIQKLAGESPDLVIFDVRMPESDALALIKMLRSTPDTPSMPIIVLTDASEQILRLEALNAGATDVVSKPVEIAEIIARVRNALSFKRYAERIDECSDLVNRELDRDALIHLHSRRLFHNRLADEFALGRTSNLSLIVLEISAHAGSSDEQSRNRHEQCMEEAFSNFETLCEQQEFVTRIGRDEFAIICRHAQSQQTMNLAENLQNLGAKPIGTGHAHGYESNVNIGIARYTPTVTSSEMLFDMADSALYYAKLDNNSTVRVYSELEAELAQHQHKNDDADNSVLLEQVDPHIGKILIVDDEPLVSGMLFAQLSESGYQQIDTENDATKAIARVHEYQPDLVILDIRMPKINGLEILSQLKSDELTSSIPILIMTSSNDDRIRMAALKLQANDFLMKPANAAELDVRVNNALRMKFQTDQVRRVSARLRFEVEVRTNELFATRREAILCLARTAESRDDQTGLHVIRVGRYAGAIGRKMGLDENFVSWLELAAQLHDVGKIAISDAILYKPGKLTEEEYDIMKTHCQEANRILGGTNEAGYNACTSPLLQMAGRIALTHHERWDGTGYPNQLAENQIPLEGRITSVADVFDAISSRRHYKDAFSIEESFRLLKAGSGSHFDPEVVRAFFRAQDEILAIMVDHQDAPRSDS
ncbi:MAG: response regulator [Pirellulaceae bacterium]|nr:response regulator [Pirellulaceae bacterium]